MGFEKRLIPSVEPNSDNRDTKDTQSPSPISVGEHGFSVPPVDTVADRSNPLGPTSYTHRGAAFDEGPSLHYNNFDSIVVPCSTTTASTQPINDLNYVDWDKESPLNQDLNCDGPPHPDPNPDPELERSLSAVATAGEFRCYQFPNSPSHLQVHKAICFTTQAPS
jgi:hypothetical protein